MKSFVPFVGVLVLLYFHVISGADENVLKELENVDNDIENDQHDNVRFRDGNKVPGESSENEDEDENDDPNDENEGVEEDEIEEEDNDDRDMTPEEEEELRSELEESEEDMMKKSFGSVRIQNVTIPEYSQACSESMCQLMITPMGCFHDSLKKRPLPIHLESYRDVTSRVYYGKTFNWHKAAQSMRNLTCDCATRARRLGYKYFGLQFYGECWSSNSPTIAKDYKKDGKANSCVNGKFKRCTPGEFCVGQASTNYVYRIDPLIIPGQSCAHKFKKVGCFNDPHLNKARALPELLDTHRDITSKVFHGHLIDWNNYQASLEKLVCHCAAHAKKKGYSYFGIEYYGECWSGNKAPTTYNKYGASQNCVSYNLEKCNPKSNCLCAGKGFALFVYKV